VAVLVGCGTPILAYLIAWIVMPNEPWTVAAQPFVTPPPPPQPGAGAGTMGV